MAFENFYREVKNVKPSAGIRKNNNYLNPLYLTTKLFEQCLFVKNDIKKSCFN